MSDTCLKVFSSWIYNILEYFSLWGFYSAIDGPFTGKAKNFIITICHICLLLFCMFFLFETITIKYSYLSFIDFLNFVLYHMSFILTYSLIIVESYITRNYEQAFWMDFIRINGFRSHTIYKQCNYLIGLTLLLVSDVFVILYSIIRAHMYESMGNNIFHLINLSLVDNRIFFYLLHLKVIEFHIGQINDAVIQEQNRFERSKIKWIRNYYQLVYEMSERVNSIFGWSQLAVILFTFHSSLTFLNFIYRQFRGQFTKMQSGSLELTFFLTYMKAKIKLNIFCRRFSNFKHYCIVSCRVSS